MRIRSLIFILGVLSGLSSAFSQDPKRFEDQILTFRHEDAGNPSEEGINLFVGSSSIRKWSDMAERFSEYNVLNRGFGGSHFSDALYYADDLIFAHRPAKVFIYEGDNDIGTGKDPVSVLAEAKALRALVEEKLPGVPVAFISPKPSVYHEARMDTFMVFNAMLRKYAEQTPNTEFINVWDPAIDEDGRIMRHIFASDSLHLNTHGYDIWERVIEPYLVK